MHLRYTGSLFGQLIYDSFVFRVNAAGPLMPTQGTCAHFCYFLTEFCTP